MRWGAWKYATTLLGLAAGGAGGYLVSIDGQCEGEPPVEGAPCPTLKDTALLGYSSIGVGAGLLGVGIYMLISDRPIEPRSPPPVAVIPTNGGVMAAVSWSY